MIKKFLIVLLCLILIPSQVYGALNFTDGDTDKVDHGSAANLDNLSQGTVMMWIKLSSVADSLRGFCAKGSQPLDNGWILFQKGSDGTQLKFDLNRSTSAQNVESNSGDLVVNEWTFIAATWDIPNGSPKIYIGNLGTSISDRTSSPTDGSGTQTDDSSANLTVGNNQPSGNNSIPGDIAFIHICNRDLSQAEIQQQQYRPHKIADTVLFVYYGFNGTGTQTDYSGNGNSGTVTGATIADHAPLPAPFGG